MEKLKKNARANCDMFIERLAVAKAKENNTTMAMELRKMRQAEMQRSISRRIKKVTGKNNLIKCCHSSSFATVGQQRERGGTVDP